MLYLRQHSSKGKRWSNKRKGLKNHRNGTRYKCSLVVASCSRQILRNCLQDVIVFVWLNFYSAYKSNAIQPLFLPHNLGMVCLTSNPRYPGDATHILLHRSTLQKVWSWVKATHLLPYILSFTSSNPRLSSQFMFLVLHSLLKEQLDFPRRQPSTNYLFCLLIFIIVSSSYAW